MERYEKVYSSPINVYKEGSPVIIEAAVLHKDNKNGKILAQIKIRNLCPKNVTACKISIRAYEPNGTELEGIGEFMYLDINVPKGGEFGTKTPVYLPDNKTRRMELSVTEVVFNDGTTWNSELGGWEQIPAQEKIFDHFSDRELQRQYEIEAGGNCPFIPVLRKGLFQCACGTINLSSEGYCSKCGRKSEDLIAALEEDSLKEKRDARIQKEKEEREKEERRAAEAAEQARLAAEKKKKRTKKALSIIIPTIILVVAFACLYPNVIKPAINNYVAYRNAEKLLEQGKFDDANKAFLALGNYRDSKEKSKEVLYEKAEAYYQNEQYAQAIATWNIIKDYSDSAERCEKTEFEWKEGDYLEAQKLLDDKKYAEAYHIFVNILSYKDAAEKSRECKYLEAKSLVEQGDYEEAIRIFKAYLKYKDSADLYKSVSYEYAVKLFDEGKYDKAISYFTKSDGYDNAAEYLNEAHYNYGIQLLNEKKYQDAANEFDRCSSYKDAASKSLDAKYNFVIGHKVVSSTTTYHYLEELIKNNYPGAQAIYNELYAWHATVTINNGSSSVRWNRRTNVDIKITGGKPTQTTKIKGTVIYPNGDTDQAFEDTWVRVGMNETVSFYWDDGCMLGPYNGTLTIRIYDENNNLIGSGSIKVTN